MTESAGDLAVTLGRAEGGKGADRENGFTSPRPRCSPISRYGL